MTADPEPRVGIVVVNYFGGDRTRRCLASLEALTWPAERLAVALVDNGSEPGFAGEVRARFPSVRVVEAGSNLGFGGGCNRGFDALADCDYVALLNNDATPDPGWLEPLVDALEADPRLGAATPKVLLEGRFVTIELRSPTIRPGGGDTRRLGVQLCGAAVDGVDVSGGVELVSGFWGWEHDDTTVGGPFAWTDGHGVLQLRVPAEPCDHHTLRLRVACGVGATTAEVLAGPVSVTVPVGIRPAWVEVGDVGPGFDLVNNAGLVLRADGSTADRGDRQPDGVPFDVAAEVFGWSGAAVLLSRRFLDDVGRFEEPFFLYYEDVDLSWRGRLRGWGYRFVPESVVRHEHSATVGDRSELVRHLAERNRLLTLTRNAPADVVRRALSGSLRALLLAVGRDVLARLVRARRPVLRHAVDQARVLAGFVRLAPAALRQRRVTSSAARDAAWTWTEPV